MSLQDPSFGKLLKHYRDCQEWTQERASEKLGVAPRTYQDWEEGKRIPNAANCDKIVGVFELSEEQANTLRRAAKQVAPEIHNLPFPQNPFFTGRKAHLERLDQLLKENGSDAITQPISISGLGGIGKTQLALEYAHHSYPKVYRTVLWANAADSSTLEKSYLSLADLLQLPEKDEHEAGRVVQAVKTWLERHTSWLLILDNADDLQLVRSYLPTKPHGHMLLTTRSQIVGNIAARIEVEAMERGEGLLFLLKRSGMLKDGSESDTLPSNIHSTASQLVELLGGHPLALDQAGAYIEETRDSFATYLQLYSDQRLTLLNERGSLGGEHPETVVVTFEISFQQARERYPMAADVLRFCAFLHPDDIPEELFSQDDGLKLNVTIFNNAMKVLRSYSLIKRNPEKKTLSVHHLVQAVLRDSMPAEAQQHWMQRAVQAVNAAFPNVKFGNWPTLERLLPHALICATWIEQAPFASPEASRLLNQAGVYLKERMRFTEAEPLLKRAMAISEQELGGMHPDTASSLNNLAALYRSQGKYGEAEPLSKRALAIYEQELGTMHPNTANSLNNLANLYRAQGRYTEAEPLYERALAIYEQELGAMHPDIASNLHNLGALYNDQGRYGEAELLLKRALAIKEQQLGAIHPDTASSLNSLAFLYWSQGKYAEAEPLYERALAIYEKFLGEIHPDTTSNLNNLAALYWKQGRYTEAEPLYERALAITEQELGAMHPSTALSLNNLAVLYWKQGRYTEAKPLYERALAVREQQLGGMHPDTASSLNNLANLYRAQGKYTEAEPLLKRALAVCEQGLGPSHPDTAQSLNNLAGLYDAQGKYGEAEPLYQRALLICEQELGATHPDTAGSLNNLAGLYREQGKDTEAEPLLKRALAIYEQALGTSHPDTAISLNNLAELYRAQGKYEQAEPLLKRALAIYEQALGTSHPDTAISLNNLALLYDAQGKYEETEPLYQRALEIREQQLGSTHPDTQTARRNYASLLRTMGRDAEAKKLEEKP